MTARRLPRPDEVSDEDLMRRIQADDRRAFEALFDRYSARAFGLARAICSSDDDAQDALQDGFLAVWSSRGSFDPARGDARPWLLTVIRHRTLDQLRRTRRSDRRRASGDLLEQLVAPGSLSEQAEAADEASQLRCSMRGLPPAQAEVIELAYFGGLTNSEIATRLNLPAGTVKGRLRLGLQKIRVGVTPGLAADHHRPEADSLLATAPAGG